MLELDALLDIVEEGEVDGDGHVGIGLLQVGHRKVLDDEQEAGGRGKRQPRSAVSGAGLQWNTTRTRKAAAELTAVRVYKEVCSQMARWRASCYRR